MRDFEDLVSKATPFFPPSQSSLNVHVLVYTTAKRIVPLLTTV